MSAFFGPRFYTHQEPNLRGLFRLIDDFDQYSAQNAQGHRSRQVQVFTPKFDLKETESSFELHGELPGLEKENVHIEFTDPQTVVVRGKVERSHTAGTPPAVDAKSDEASGASNLSEEPVVVEHDHSSDAGSEKSHHATVEDDVEEGTVSQVQNTPATTVAETPKPTEAPKPAAPKAKYWVSERSVGQFARSFQFPSRVEHEAVAATLNNGILTVTVPKAKKHESRRIAIN